MSHLPVLLLLVVTLLVIKTVVFLTSVTPAKAVLFVLRWDIVKASLSTKVCMKVTWSVVSSGLSWSIDYKII